MEAGEGSSSAPPMAMDTTAQTGDAIGLDWQQECYNKLQLINDKYLTILVDWLRWVFIRLRQQSLTSELHEKLIVFRKMLIRLLSLLAIPKNAITNGIQSKMVFLENLILGIVAAHEKFTPQALWKEQSQHLSVANAHPRANQALQINVQGSGMSLQATGIPVDKPVTASCLDHFGKRLWVPENDSIINSDNYSMPIKNSITKKLRVSETVVQEKPKEPTFTCPICLGTLVSPSTTACGHIFCDTCIRDAIQSRKKSCPICREKINKNKIHRVFLPAAAAE